MFLVVAAPARAGATKVTWPVFIQLKAAPHTTNHVKVIYYLRKGRTPDDGVFIHLVSDTAGMTTRVTEPPTCYPVGRGDPSQIALAGKAVVCPDGSAVGDFPPGLGEDFRAFLGDRDDSFDAQHSLGSFEVHAGSGKDRLYGNDQAAIEVDFDTNTVCGSFTEDELYGDSGNDRLYGRRGPDLLSGGSGNDRLYGGRAAIRHEMPGGRFYPGFASASGDNLRGGSGDDVLHADNHARDTWIDCGPGRDTAYVDKRDPKTKHCEKVKRR